jgi:lipoate-protein ligase A
MTSALRILDTDLAPARWNVAMTAALVRRHCDGEAPDTLRFHRYPACVLVGNGQRLSDSIDLAYCRHRGIEIARRVTGGGAVFMSPSMLAWDVVLDRRRHSGGLDSLTRHICEGIAAGLVHLGAAASFAPPNAVAIAGRKVSGSSGYLEGRSAVLQGTVLIKDDTSEMAAALGLPEAGLRRSVSCLAASLGVAPSMAGVQAALVASLAGKLQMRPDHAEPDQAERALAQRILEEEIGTDDFVVGADRHIPESVP